VTGDVFYVLGTLIQLVAFGWGMRTETLGVALMVYGAGIVVAKVTGTLR
jgi:hypothetical protein